MTNLKEIKNWDSKIEKKITTKWKDSEMYNVSPNTRKKIYSIDTPPPYVNSPIHIAQAVTYCYMDFFARYKRMKGFDVIFPLGLDRNGLPIELATEKKFKISPFKIGREEFIKKCEELINEGSSETTQIFAELGISFTSYKEGTHPGAVYKTDSPEYRKLTQSTFIELYKKGLIYEDSRINNWDPKLQTTIADSEIDYKEIPSTFNDIIWKLKGTNEEFIIATTRPELIATCAMVIYNPKDDRYKKLKGKTIISPIFEREIPIKAHHFADPEKGSGLMMICSAGDLTDIQFFREQNLTPAIAIEKDGTMNENAGFLNGLKVKEARKKIIEKLKNMGLIKNQVQINHRTPISERSGAEVEFIKMPEFYLKQIEFIEDIKKISRKIKFYPEESRMILEKWIDSISIDWPISRRRFYATPIPLWNSGNLTALPPEGNYYIPWKEDPPKNSLVFENGKNTGMVSDFPEIKWEGETRVFDTWMDSSISELVILKYQEDEGFFKKAYPASLRPQGKEIVRTWLYYTILRGYLETKKPCFESAWIHQHLTDEKGKKMSKSQGNVINPKDLVKKYGAEAIRMWASTEGNLAKNDLKVSEEKIKAETKTLNKLLNISKFVSLFKRPKTKPKLATIDKLFIDYLGNLAKESDEKFNEYDFYTPLVILRDFLWETLASHYIELVKSRAYNEENKFSQEESNSARYTINYILDNLLTLLYPVIPQVTSTIADSRGFNLLEAEFPKLEFDKQDFTIIEKIKEFNSTVWKKKKDEGISLKNPISNIKIPEELKQFKSDLKICHNLK